MDLLDYLDNVEPEVTEETPAEEGKGEEQEAPTEEKAEETADSEKDDGEEKEVEEEQAPTEEEAPAEEKPDSEEKEDVDPLEAIKNEQAEMRALLRATRRENAALKAKLGRVDKTVDENLGDGEEKELTRLEVLSGKLKEIGNARGPQLELYFEQMSEMQKYSDIAEVCSEQNVQSLIETAANVIKGEQGGDLDELMLELEVDIWSRPNPYKYLYEVIKTHHPKYAGKKEEGKSAGKGDGKATPKIPAAKTASSIQDIGGGGSDKNTGWTADKIDRLPEDELNKVPKDVYEKYMQGLLN